ncbi:hypothetical protein V495_04293 [Pseudogymnoascus sp. VKM F-4514 (FW-929)]|nr:hypothetical protein V490_07925 [Pseudogymnoascus sp. VKM F-3557]KFY42879.1 hypothetical protein V495_04293 [Pseudogymnoascus sp. VKM F-4514 (FW-929)]KFY59748.1 hypothetical protein V497_04110 [Pseudogymnoascus sp. VKM F-4516 (FW-969)]
MGADLRRRRRIQNGGGFGWWGGVVGKLQQGTWRLSVLSGGANGILVGETTNQHGSSQEKVQWDTTQPRWMVLTTPEED